MTIADKIRADKNEAARQIVRDRCKSKRKKKKRDPDPEPQDSASFSTLPLPLEEPVPEREGHSDAWYTPAWVLDRVRDQWPDGIDLDPAWHPACLVKARKTHTLKDDGLAHEWTGNVWNNPPYSSPKEWILKARASAKHGAKILQLVKFDPSTSWFNLIWESATSIAIFRRRMSFVSGSERNATTANFPVCLVYWAGPGAPYDDFHRVWSKHAQIVHWEAYTR